MPDDEIIGDLFDEITGCALSINWNKPYKWINEHSTTHTQIGVLASNRFYDGGAYGNLFGLDGLFNFSDNWKFQFEIFVNSNKEPIADWINSEKKFGVFC